MVDFSIEVMGVPGIESKVLNKFFDFFSTLFLAYLGLKFVVSLNPGTDCRGLPRSYPSPINIELDSCIVVPVTPLMLFI